MANEIIIKNNEGILTVSSVQVAKDFEKRHKNVIRAIEDLIDQTSAQNSANLFYPSIYADKYGRNQKAYEMTRDGFSLLVMGFTGKKALDWKLKYIDAFNIMEQQLLVVNHKANLLLTIYGGGVEGVVASRKLVELETKPLVDQIEKDKPLVEFAGHIQQSEDSISIAEMAKVASKNGVKIGRNNLFKFLREKNVIMVDNEPYQKYIDNDWLELVENTYTLPSGEIKISKKPMVKPKGQTGIVKMLKKYCA